MSRAVPPRGQAHAPSMKVPPKRKGNPINKHIHRAIIAPSMKVPPKRKGNLLPAIWLWVLCRPSMKVPPKRKGNFCFGSAAYFVNALNESPSEKEGKFKSSGINQACDRFPSMKVPPKRKGNPRLCPYRRFYFLPSMKVPPKRKGNRADSCPWASISIPSMKVPPKRKGNHTRRTNRLPVFYPQ